MVETLAWETLSTYMAEGRPCALHLGGTRGAQMVFDAVRRRLALRLPMDESDPIPRVPLASMRIERLEIAGELYLRC